MRKLPQIPSSQPDTKKDRALVVDSEHLMVRVTRRILEDQGYVIDNAATTADAFETLVRGQYRYILVDDSIDEFELKAFLGAIRNVIEFRGLIVILSDRTFQVDPSAAPVAFLQKPFTYDELVDLVASVT